jgi:hypothetical protein
MSEAGVRKSYVDTSGGQIHVRSMAGAKAGEGVPVVFFHQTASSGQMWLKTMHLLAGQWPMHALDTPGFGGSFDAAEDHSPSMTEYVGWLGEAVRAEPGRSSSWIALANVELMRGKREPALEAMRRASAAEHDRGPIRATIAGMLEAAGMPEEAAKYRAPAAP